MPEIDGNKKVTLEELKLVHDLKLDKDFSGLTALPQSPANTDLLAIQNSSTTYKVPMSAISPSPLVVAITSGQWSGSGSDYYITVNASNVTANSILVPNYDSSSAAYLNGPVWCVPAAGSFTIHTSAIPSGTVNILVQFPGVMGEANYQVLADVYSKSQTYSKSEAVAKADIVNNLTSSATDKPLSAAQGKALYDAMAIEVIDDSYTDKDSHISGFHARKFGKIVTLSFGLDSGVADNTTLFKIPSSLTPAFVHAISPLFIDSSGAVYANGGVWITLSNANKVMYYGSTTTAYAICSLTYMVA